MLPKRIISSIFRPIFFCLHRSNFIGNDSVIIISTKCISLKSNFWNPDPKKRKLKMETFTDKLSFWFVRKRSLKTGRESDRNSTLLDSGLLISLGGKGWVRIMPKSESLTDFLRISGQSSMAKIPYSFAKVAPNRETGTRLFFVPWLFSGKKRGPRVKYCSLGAPANRESEPDESERERK